MKQLLFITLLTGAVYMQCNESNWQQYYPDMGGCDLSYADLSGAYLYGANFYGATLFMANLTYANLMHANLETYLYGANLAYANLMYANLEGANLTLACLEGATGFTQNGYVGAPILEGCAPTGGGDCSFEDLNGDGYDDASYTSGFIAGYSDGVVIGIESVDITTDNLEAYNIGFSAGQASADTNNDGLVDEFPTISIIGQEVLQLEETTEENYTDSGATCQDAQDGTISQNVEVSGSVVNMSIPGTYTLYYNCSDSDGNEAQTASRTVIVLEECLFSDADTNNDGLVDEFPTISIYGETVLQLEETTNGSYVDDGAACQDAQDGTISQNIEVSGDVVNMSNPRTYTINYNCSDSDGNEAQTANRTVIVLEECLFSDLNEDGHDDDSYNAGAASGDVNLDLDVNVVDIVTIVSIILYSE